jgi:hypothetical protein
MKCEVRIALCYVAILFAWADDAIAACTASLEDVEAAALDNEYLSERPLASELAGPAAPAFAIWDDNKCSRSEITTNSAAPVVPGACITEARHILLMTMRC